MGKKIVELINLYRVVGKHPALGCGFICPNTSLCLISTICEFSISHCGIGHACLHCHDKIRYGPVIRQTEVIPLGKWLKVETSESGKRVKTQKGSPS